MSNKFETVRSLMATQLEECKAEIRFLYVGLAAWRELAKDLLEVADGPVFSEQMAVFKHRFAELDKEILTKVLENAPVFKVKI